MKDVSQRHEHANVPRGPNMQKPKLIYYNDSRHYLMYRYDPP